MTSRSRAKRSKEDALKDGEMEAGLSGEGHPSTTPVFNPKGIGSNVFLAATAAFVPLVIVGVAGIKAIMRAKTPRR